MVKKLSDISGRRFGRLVVIKRFGRNEWNQTLYNCVCDCGTECLRMGTQLVRLEKLGKRQSCGCWKNELAAARLSARQTHGMTTKAAGVSSNKLYDVWKQMLRRCENKKSLDYSMYGGRGIKVCRAWHDGPTFIKWAMDSGYEPGLTVERKNVNGHYSPSNCTWVPNPMQSRNTRKNRIYTFQKRTLCLSEWSRYLGINYRTLAGRLNNGWPVKQAFTVAPLKGRNQFR